jgi:serine protease AprX
MVCVAAGNEGPEPNTIASPGISDKVLTVGALDDRDTMETRMDDDVAEFSSRGPTIYGVPKPDILAPGVDIVSYFVLSGTYMATPIVAGIAALMLQYNPNFTPDEMKQRLLAKADLGKIAIPMCTAPDM